MPWGTPKMDILVSSISKLKMVLVTHKHQAYPSMKNADETIKFQKISLDDLETKLLNFDSEAIYSKIHKDLTEKYDIAGEYYKSIEDIRKKVIGAGCCSNKQTLISKLDEVVTTLRKDFSKFTEEKYRVLDEIFIIRINYCDLKCDLEELAERIETILDQPEIVYDEQYQKICKIYKILEEEEKSLNEKLLQIKVT